MQSPGTELKAQKLFGTDGIRGVAGIFPLDAETVSCIGDSLARIFTERLGRAPRFVIGRDTRESGEWIEKAFCEGALSAGAACDSAGVITTPGVAFITNDAGYDAGIVISASHNPFEDNGLKIFLPSGKKLDEATEKRIEADVQQHVSNGRENGKSQTVQHAHTPAEFHAEYLDHLREHFSGLDLSGRRVVIDCANGAASALAPELFSEFGAEVIAIHAEPDGRNINEKCGSLHLEDLQRAVKENSANIGIAFDGDADRSLFVDENGAVVDGDATLWILACHSQNKGGLANGKVVATVMSNIGLEIAFRDKGITLVRASVGDKYVLEELLKTGSEIGGEQSGHIIFPGLSLVGDGMLTALSTLNVMQEESSKLSALVTGFERYPQILVNVRVRDKVPFEHVPEIVAGSLMIENELREQGRLLLRYSGTENLARVMIEGQDQTEIESQANRLADIIRTAIG
jgi:phosphoglucosamine mutase